LSPYIYGESLHASRTGRPLTLPLFLIEKGNDPEELSYMFGREIVVSPAVDEEMKVRKLILPEGEWVNLWSGETYSGTVSIHGSRSEVYLRKGSIIPVSVPSDESLFGTNWSQEEMGQLHVGNEWPKDIGEPQRSGKARRVARIIGNEQGIIKIEWRDIE
ncbi:MAG TPA: glycoside hydrolase family 31 protein, partial [Mesotoga sp.]|nr:glycoside hydrolase family 31 protein [Mesotoga sp.]